VALGGVAVTILQVLVKLDIAVMRVLGGMPSETLSSAAWNAHLTNGWWGWTYLAINALFFFLQRDHCRKDWEYRKEIYQ
jgi:hypothetical protein